MVGGGIESIPEMGAHWCIARGSFGKCLPFVSGIVSGIVSGAFLDGAPFP